MSVNEIALASILEARLIRRVGEVVIRNLEREVMSPRFTAQDRETLDLAMECDPHRLQLSDFTRADFESALRIIKSKETAND